MVGNSGPWANSPKVRFSETDPRLHLVEPRRFENGERPTNGLSCVSRHMLRAGPRRFAHWRATDIASYRFARRRTTEATDPNQHSPVTRPAANVRLGHCTTLRLNLNMS